MSSAPNDIIFLYVLTPEGDIRPVPRNQVLGVSWVFSFVIYCAMLIVVLVVSERRASACLMMLSAKQGSHWYHFNAFGMALDGVSPSVFRCTSTLMETGPIDACGET